jgi:HD-GYP domain-containing protein (c-di-GMP phosphodiesterase class II)
MRYIPSNCLRPGQILASDLVMEGRKVMLRKGVQLNSLLISRIEQLGFQGVYIIDDLSRDLEVANVISDTLKYKAKADVQSLYISIQNKTESRAHNQLDLISRVISDIVDEILYNRKLMVNVVDLRTFDDYTFSHSVNVAVLSVVMGTVLGLNRTRLNELAMGALIHDIGKVFIDRRIINKAGRLTPEEFTEMKKHSEKGYNYLRAHSQVSEQSLKAVLLHHEQYNGNGYPFGFSGEQIDFFGRIVCVADVYDALTSDRPYRRAMLPSDAMEYVMGGYGTMFDPKVVKAFTRKVAPYPIGTCVKLSNGLIGIVVQNYELSCLRPRLRLIVDNKPTEDYLDLTTDNNTLNVTIREIIQL